MLAKLLRLVDVDAIKRMDKKVLLIRTTAVLLMLRWTVWLWMLYSDDLGSVFSFGFWYLVLEKVFIGVVLNIGLWLSTTEFGLKRHYFTLGLMTPTICLSPFVMPRGIFVEGSIFVIVVVVLAIFLLIRKKRVAS